FYAHYPIDETYWLWEGVLSYGIPLDAGGAQSQSVSYSVAPGQYTEYTDFIFQAMFAATAATIVSGAVAERIKLAPFMVFAVVFVGFGYPFVGSWHWGGGWLSTLADGDGFYDFAGSSVVHAFGGFGALAGVLLLGPRLGKYGSDGSPKALPGHNIPLVNIGVFLLFLGWFGFNGGSVLSADEANVSLVFVTTALAGVAGGAVALLTSWGISGKPDVTMGLNGLLAGLVGITAGADSISPGFSILVGGIAGVLVVVSVLGFDQIKIDDPVGAISVHGVCGIWGTLAVGIFGGKDFVAQLIGTVAVSVTAFLIALVIFGILKVLGGIRVSEEEEIEGLDLGEHGMSAYHTLTPGS
ncbi:MAG: ammonium transporter, partial [Planctomycetota bacterium]